MAVSSEVVEQKLKGITESLFYGKNPETLTVRVVREKTEAALKLKPGFLTEPAWRDKAKSIIKRHVVSINSSDARLRSRLLAGTTHTPQGRR